MNFMHWPGSYGPPKIILQRDLAKIPEAITLKPLTSGVWEGQNQTSGHRITLYTNFHQNKKCDGVNLT